MLIAGRVARETNAELIEDLAVFFRHHHGGVGLATIKQWQSRKRTAAVLIVERKHRKSDQHLLRMQTRIAAV